jgi:methionine biosynthesis protein MetW
MSSPAERDPDQNADAMLSHPPDPLRYDHQTYDADESPALLGTFIPMGARVLDVGCGPGAVSCLIRDHRNARVVGVEPNAERAAVGRGRGLEVHTGYVTPELLATLGRFDAIMFADVLEHLVDPAAMLRLVTPALQPGGVIVASVPNIAHWTVRLRLLVGRFDFTESGIMDATHLRWFTARTLRELFERSGLVVQAMSGSAGQWLPEYRRLPGSWRRRLVPRLARIFPRLFSCQLIIRVSPAPPP